MALGVTRENKAARRAYERIGFREMTPSDAMRFFAKSACLEHMYMKWDLRRSSGVADAY
jgi:RimJ/RimL family protein N-acetyltransferase